MVGAVGFEPTAFCSRSKRATRLRYAPTREFSQKENADIILHCAVEVNGDNWYNISIMNRILFDHNEIHDGVAVFGDARAAHVLDVLHGEVGQRLKTGELDGRVGTSEIIAIGGDSESGRTVTVRVDHAEESLAPWVDLILAPPRPRVMKRLLPQLAAMGVGRIVLVGARKVEKDFWGATLLKPENSRPLLVDGLMQAGTSAVPKIELRRNFRKFVADELDAMFPSGARVVAHPYKTDCETRAFPLPPAADGRLLLAVGPEGGWSDDEVSMLEGKGFRRYSLGRRILRSDTATIALLAKLSSEDS